MVRLRTGEGGSWVVVTRQCYGRGPAATECRME
jgi:hypothetical protein